MVAKEGEQLMRRLSDQGVHVPWRELGSIAIVCGVLLALPPEGHAQENGDTQSTWATDVGVASANALVGGLTAAITAAIRGDDVSDAFLKGTVGGAVVFAGKRVAVERFDGAGLLGRQVASLGTGLVVDAGQGREWFSEVWLPLGPAWFQVRSGAGREMRVNLQEVGVLLWAATRSELHFDLGRSLSNGAPVWFARDHHIEHGSSRPAAMAAGSVVFLGAPTERLELEVAQSHENIHVIQADYVLQTMSRPIERWAWDRAAGWRLPFDVNTVAPVLAYLLTDLIEREAYSLQLR